jgi:hypothetical protein
VQELCTVRLDDGFRRLKKSMDVVDEIEEMRKVEDWMSKAEEG